MPERTERYEKSIFSSNPQIESGFSNMLIPATSLKIEDKDVIRRIVNMHHNLHYDFLVQISIVVWTHSFCVH